MSEAVRYGPERKLWMETLSPIATSREGRLLVSPPSRDPLMLYDFKRESITSSWYQVPSTALSQIERQNALTESAKLTEVSAKDVLGFQANLRDFSHASCLNEFLGTHLNNGGSPFGASPGDFVTLWMERNVLDYYIYMLHCGTPSGLMIPRIPKPTGATLSLWAPQRETSMLCGMHAITSLGSTPVGVMKKNPSAPFLITSISSADALLTTQMPLHQLHSTPMKHTTPS